MDTIRPAALLSWERTWADSPVVRGKARRLAPTTDSGPDQLG